jgi:hypothetical protein
MSSNVSVEVKSSNEILNNPKKPTVEWGGDDESSEDSPDDKPTSAWAKPKDDTENNTDDETEESTDDESEDYRENKKLLQMMNDEMEKNKKAIMAENAALELKLKENTASLIKKKKDDARTHLKEQKKKELEKAISDLKRRQEEEMEALLNQQQVLNNNVVITNKALDEQSNITDIEKIQVDGLLASMSKFPKSSEFKSSEFKSTVPQSILKTSNVSNPPAKASAKPPAKASAKPSTKARVKNVKTGPKECRNGNDCWTKNCKFLHTNIPEETPEEMPVSRAGCGGCKRDCDGCDKPDEAHYCNGKCKNLKCSGWRKCSYGANCNNDNCGFRHAGQTWSNS